MHFALNPISALHCLEGRANVAAASGLCLLTCFEASLFALHSILPVACILALTLIRLIGAVVSNEYTLALRSTNYQQLFQTDRTYLIAISVHCVRE